MVGSFFVAQNNIPYTLKIYKKKKKTRKKMFFDEKTIHIRTNHEINFKISMLLRRYSGLYESKSHLIRCAIIELYNQKMPKKPKK